MSKITLIYPTWWLDIDIVVKDRETWDTEFTWTMEEIVSGIYKYDFTEVAGIDYVYTATTIWYNDMSGVIYATSWWLTPTQDAQLQQIYNRVDTKVSYVSYGSWWWFNYEDFQKKFTELKDEIKKEILNKQFEVNFDEILQKIEDIKVSLEDNIEIEDIEEITSKEIKPLIQKVNLIKKYVDDKKKEETEEEKQWKELSKLQKELLEDLENEQLSKLQKVIEEKDKEKQELIKKHNLEIKKINDKIELDKKRLEKTKKQIIDWLELNEIYKLIEA